MASVVDELRDWDWVAIGTILLAVATFALAMQNRSVVASSREEAKQAGEGLDLARQQNATAEATLAAQTQPLLTSLPPGVFRDTITWRTEGGEERESTRDAAHIEVAPIHGIAVPIRNVGTGIALIQSVSFWFGEWDATGNARNTALPPGEWTMATLAVDRESDFAIDVAALNNLSVTLGYADVGGVSRGFVRLDVYLRDLAEPRWTVRQVHFASTIDAVRNDPDIGSAPMF
jgi:hypothetical protein